MEVLGSRGAVANPLVAAPQFYGRTPPHLCLNRDVPPSTAGLLRICAKTVTSRS